MKDLIDLRGILIFYESLSEFGNINKGLVEDGISVDCGAPDIVLNRLVDILFGKRLDDEEPGEALIL